MDLNIIVPIYNEEGNISTIYKEISKTLNKVKYKIIFVDDGSCDNSFEILNDLYKKDSLHIKVISFSRNFGKEAAMYAGIKESEAKYTCIIDADMQQNPKYILEMYNFLENNPEYDEVALISDYKTIKASERLFKKCFYKILGKLSNLNTKAGASDFRMFRKGITDALIEMKEINRFLKGLFAYAGFNIYYMNYTQEKRLTGKSKFSITKQFKYAKDGILNFSTVPLKIASILGTIISIGAFIYLIEIIIQTIWLGKDVPGYASLMCITLLLGGIILLVLGIIGEYIAKIHIEIKNRPIYIIKNTLGCKKNSDIL